MSAATEIPLQGEKWFKGMPLDTSCYMDFIKPEYRNQKIGANIPSQYLLEPFEKLLKIIRNTSPVKEDSTRCIHTTSGY
jgi:hypothetical protein